MTPIEIALLLLLLHGVLGAVDTFFHHEWLERLPERPFASRELALHAARSLAFVLIFSGLAWLEWRGAWGWALLALLGVESVLTLADSVVEDRTRVLRASERINHMLLAMNTGAYTAFVGWQVIAEWRHAATALVPTRHPLLSELLTACAIVIAIWVVRDGLAAVRTARRATPRDDRGAAASSLPSG
jgi:hypothetical protein